MYIIVFNQKSKPEVDKPNTSHNRLQEAGKERTGRLASKMNYLLKSPQGTKHY